MKRFLIVLAIAGLIVGGWWLWQKWLWSDPPERDQFYVISHKTAGLEYAENSLEGLRASLAMDVAAIELDVHMVKDGAIVLHHDPVLSSYNCFSKDDDARLIVAQQTAEDLAALDCMNHKVGKPYKIVTLDEFLSVYRDSDQSKKLLLEIKVWDELIENNPLHVGLDIEQMHYPDSEVVQAVYKVLRRYPEVTNIQFNTFGPDLLLKLREEMRPEESYEFGLLYKGSYDPTTMALPAWWKSMQCYEFCWVPDYRKARRWLDSNDIDIFIPNFQQASSLPFRDSFQQHILRNKGELKVIPWTLNEPKEWEVFEEMDFDGVLTDKPTEFNAWADERVLVAD